MATAGGPNIERDGLVFGYDTNYGTMGTDVAYRFNKGEPTTNLVTNPDFSTGDLTGWSSTDTSNSQVDTSEVAFENRYYYFHKKCTSTGAGGHDRLNQSSTYTLDTSLKTTVTIDIWINPSNAYSISFYGLGSTADDTTYNEKPLSSNSSDVTTIDLGGGWTRYIYTLQTGWYTGSGTSFRVAVYPGYSGTGLMEYKVKRLQVEQKEHATPFVNGTRSSTQSIIDLKKTTNIDVSNVSFDSDGQPTFDGTDDRIDSVTGIGITDYSQPFTMECVFMVPTGATWANGFNSNIFSIAGSYAGQYGFYKYGTTNIGFQIRDASTGTYPATAGLTRDTYHHITAVFQGGSGLVLYKNGVSVSNSTTSFSGAPDSTNLYIGGQRAFGGNVGSWFQGEIPVAKYYNRALSAQEVQQNYNSYKNRFNI